MLSTNPQKEEQLKKIRDDVFALTTSPLYTYRKENNYYPVLGQGNHNADIMFIGEAPGKNEAESGRPFCGAAGKILDQLLASINLPRSEVYITNIVKDRPPGNRDPLPEEIALYAPFLDRQIEVIQPNVVATLGRFSMEYIMHRYGLGDQCATISTIHGNVFSTTGPGGNTIHIVPLYHPAAAIYSRSKLPELETDMKVLTQFLKGHPEQEQ
jgi:DNA polymerase